MAYIYKILNLKNNKIYIGSTKNLKKRKYTHFHLLKKKTHPNRYLQNAWNKNGENSFEFILLEEVDDFEQFEIEQKYLNEYEPFDERGYNISRNVNNPFNHLYDLTCNQCLEPFLSYNKHQPTCSDDCQEEYDINAWRRSQYIFKSISNWDVDDHTAAWYDDMMEK